MSSCCPVGQPPSLLCLCEERSPRRPASGTLLAEGHRSVLALPPPCQVSALVEVRLVVVEAGSGAEVALDELPVLRGELAPVHRETTAARGLAFGVGVRRDRKSTRLNSSHVAISYAVFCLKKKNKDKQLVITYKQFIVKFNNTI